MSALTLNIGDELAVALELRLPGVEAVVEVRAEGGRVQESLAVGTVIDRGFVENMPLSGRTFQSLFDLTPGVLRSGVGNGQFVVNGQRDTNSFLVDGVSANANVSAAPTVTGVAGTLPSLSVLNTTNTLASVDALQEFKILTSSYAPELGRTPDGQVSLVTRSGTNTFTGSVFEYFRHEEMEANDWFANRDGLPKPPTRQHDFGGVIGGPVVLPGYDGHNRAFFFASYEALRLEQPQVTDTVVPSLATRAAAVPAMRVVLDAYPQYRRHDQTQPEARPRRRCIGGRSEDADADDTRERKSEHRPAPDAQPHSRTAAQAQAEQAGPPGKRAAAAHSHDRPPEAARLPR